MFGYLDGVEGGTFAYLVADTPESQSVGVGEVTAYSAHVDVVCSAEE